jgi:ABC-type transporter Mla subunit MlaD
MNRTARTETDVLIAAMQELARQIISDDGVANAAISEAGDRLGEQAREISALTAELQRARGEHYRIHETLTDRIAALRTALAAVVELNLPDALPSQMLAYGHPWPAVARALWPDLAPDAPR